MGGELSSKNTPFLDGHYLKDRGFKGVQLIISDACLGLRESIQEYYPEAQWQRCMVHFYRNVFSHVPNAKVKEVARMLKASSPRSVFNAQGWSKLGANQQNHQQDQVT